MTVVLWTLVAFVSGSLPLSVWLARIALGVDIRQLGDGNPGATNVGRAGGKGWFMVAMLLDVLKGVLPVGLARWIVGINGWEIILIAIMPSLGHAFSPLLRFNGGKALATTFGVWIGLTLNEVPFIGLMLLVLFFALLTVEGWSVLLAVLFLGVYIQLFRPDAGLLVLIVLQFLLLAWTHRRDLRRRPGLRSALLRRR